MNYVVGPVQLSDIQEAREYMKGKLQPSPLVQLWEHKDIFLKLENLQPCGSFQLRGALNAIRKISIETLELGVCTASTGNFAKCLAWVANNMDIRCNVLVPSHSPMNQLSAIEELRGNITKVELDEWWEAIETHTYGVMQGKFIHAVCEPDVVAGVGTIGLEIVDCIPDISNIIVPYGGGGLICGIAIAAKSHNPNIKVYACATSGDSMSVEGSITSLQEVTDAVKLLSEGNHVRAEGAGAASVAAAMKGVVGVGKTACIISGGNIDTDKYIQCLQGTVPI
ncbi:E4.3.1.19 [Mytilus coruscus]|uniref:L-serine deaminase n=1 Tax=Mytilus coruscus TaxID=42192 RepID=A0A6J8EUJ4_MYTCO|nr:E4.3.1.19 [Mytilus coruscus]